MGPFCFEEGYDVLDCGGGSQTRKWGSLYALPRPAFCLRAGEQQVLPQHCDASLRRGKDPPGEAFDAVYPKPQDVKQHVDLQRPGAHSCGACAHMRLGKSAKP
eukprot:154752-Amphidinium_carterae.1